MQLASVEVIPYALPFKQPYVTAQGTLTRREMVLLRLRDEEGRVGLGEAVPLSLRGGATIETVVGELEELAAGEWFSRLLEHGEPIVTSTNAVDPRLVLSPPSRCAVLTALADLVERVEEADYKPAPIACNATLIAAEPAAVAEDALTWAAEGFATFKLKLGAGDDLGQVQAVREALGPAARIRVDANGAWSLPVATEMLAELEPFEIELVEQPVATMEDAVLLSKVSRIPLSGDESINSLDDAKRAVELNAFQATGIKGSKVGGVFEAMKIGEIMPAYASSALDGPVGIAAAAQLASNLDGKEDLLGPPQPRYAHGLATQRLFATTIASVECDLRRGRLYPPPGPGLGVEIDEDALQAHRL
jgi:o-succinylbenzoate synthase